MLRILVCLCLVTPALAMTQKQRMSKIEQMYADFSDSFASVKEISVPELKKLKRSEYVLIDVREEHERKVSMIPGAISKAEYEKNSSQYKKKKIIAYCTLGYRSGKFAKKLTRSGTPAINLKGSLLMWVNHGGELVNASGKTKKVHVFGKKWNLLPDDYQGVW